MKAGKSVQTVAGGGSLTLKITFGCFRPALPPTSTCPSSTSLVLRVSSVSFASVKPASSATIASTLSAVFNNGIGIVALTGLSTTFADAGLVFTFRTGEPFGVAAVLLAALAFEGGLRSRRVIVDGVIVACGAR